MAKPVITSITGTQQTDTFVTGNGAPANTWIYLSKDDHGAEFGRALSNECGEFTINAGRRGSDVYDFVVTALDCNGTVGDNQGWSIPKRHKIY